jgi:hypothetical protein
MAITRVSGQSVAGTANATSCTLSLTSNPTPGNLVVVGVCTGAQSVTISSCADTAGTPNAYTPTPLSPASNAAAANAYIFYLKNTPASAVKSVKATASSSTAIAMWLVEIAGADTTAPLHIEAIYASTTSQTNMNNPSITTTINGCYIFGVSSVEQTTTAINSPFAKVGTTFPWGDGAGDFIQSTAGAQALNFTMSPAGRWVSVLAAFKPASGAASGLFLPNPMTGLGVGGPFFANPVG